METGRAQPSREMVLHLAERLEVPLRERNVLLVAAGFAPVFRERAAARPGAGLRAQGRRPGAQGARAVSRRWRSTGTGPWWRPTARWRACWRAPIPSLLQPPVNVLRLSLHPKGLAPRIANLAEWRAHLLERLRRQVEVSADPVLVELAGGAARLPGAGQRAAKDRAANGELRRRGRAAAVRHRRRHAVVLLHHDRVRHAGRHHAVGAGAGGLLPGRRGDGGGTAGSWSGSA